MLGPCLRRQAQLYRHSGTIDKITYAFTTRSFASSNLRFGDQIASDRRIPEDVRLLMRRVTQPVTTEFCDTDGRQQRGLTVSSFTTICLTPSPFVCFSTRQNSRAADLLDRRHQFVVHLLPCTSDSARIADSFSKSDLAPHAHGPHQNPFELGSWIRHQKWDMLVLQGVLGALLCKVDRTVKVGDHQLWIAEVEDVMEYDSDTRTALSYCGRKYRKEGDPLLPHDTSED